MLRRTPPSRRRGTTTVECAVIFPVTFLMILGMLIIGLGIFRYQEVAHLARAGARYGSTHGGKYEQDGMPEKTGVPAVKGSADLMNYFLNGRTLTEGSQLVLLNPENLEVAVSWSEQNNVTPPNYPFYADPNSPNAQKVINNTITVTVTYRWVPELYLPPITLTSTSTMPMSY